MADSESTRLRDVVCATCGVVFTRPIKRGPVPKYCSATCWRHRGRCPDCGQSVSRARGRCHACAAKARYTTRILTCSHCGASFQYVRAKGRLRTCGRAECLRARRGIGRVNLDKTFSHQHQRPHAACERCGTLFKWSKDKNGLIQRFCSKSCWSAFTKERKARRRASALARSCRQCGRAFVARSLAQRFCGDVSCRRAYGAAKQKARMLKIKPERANLGRPRPCAECGRKFAPVAPKKQGPRRQKFCSLSCARRASRRLRGGGKTRERVRRAGGHYDGGVTPRRVCERDGWRCRLCGCRTPKRLRGTVDPRAPEVDHIVPISMGGDHSWDNVQCLCRRCNAEKAATIRGQLRLAM